MSKKSKALRSALRNKGFHEEKDRAITIENLDQFIEQAIRNAAHAANIALELFPEDLAVIPAWCMENGEQDKMAWEVWRKRQILACKAELIPLIDTDSGKIILEYQTIASAEKLVRSIVWATKSDDYQHVKVVLDLAFGLWSEYQSQLKKHDNDPSYWENYKAHLAILARNIGLFTAHAGIAAVIEDLVTYAENRKELLAAQKAMLKAKDEQKAQTRLETARKNHNYAVTDVRLRIDDLKKPESVEIGSTVETETETTPVETETETETTPVETETETTPVETETETETAPVETETETTPVETETETETAPIRPNRNRNRK